MSKERELLKLALNAFNFDFKERLEFLKMVEEELAKPSPTDAEKYHFVIRLLSESNFRYYDLEGEPESVIDQFIEEEWADEQKGKTNE